MSCPSSRPDLLDCRLAGTQNIVDMGIGVLSHFQAMESKGTMTREEAQKQAFACLQDMRFEGDKACLGERLHPDDADATCSSRNWMGSRWGT